jgi:hypothetical protein
MILILNRYSGIDRRKTSANITIKDKIDDFKKLLIVVLPVAESVSEDL